ncbi:MAG TPA: hypothetical protein PK813_12840 [Candidatus Hydrogenedens sp.]|nr:hypothetical protein [Candidatus Hydrogenedens sp.]
MKLNFFNKALILLTLLIAQSSFSQDYEALIAYSNGQIVKITEENKKNIFGEKTFQQKDVFVANGVTFNITYQDVNTGFNDPVLGPQRKQVLLNALSYVADVLNVSDGRLDINVSSVVLAGQFLANAGPIVVWTLPLTPGINNGCAYQHLLNGSVDPNGPSYPDMQLTVNWNYNYYLGTGNPAYNQFDLLSVLIHEITHGIGFLASIAYNDSECGGDRVDGTGWTGSQPDIYTSMDTFLITGNNNYFVNTSYYYVGQGYYFTGGDNGVYLNAPSTISVYGSRPRIYAPSTFQCGSSISHWNNLGGVMDPSIGPGTLKREYLPFEVAFLRDIGYVNASLPAQEGEGNVEGTPEGTMEGEGQSYECNYLENCPDFDNEGMRFYNELSNRFGNPLINWDTTDFDGLGIPDSWEIAVLKKVLCEPKVYWRLSATCVYLENLEILKTEPQYQLWLKDYEHVLAGLLSLGSELSSTIKTNINLENEYETIADNLKTWNELLSALGDADKDGWINRVEYNNCINFGLGLNDYVTVVLNPDLDGTQSPQEALILIDKKGLVSLSLIILLCIFSIRKSVKPPMKS